MESAISASVLVVLTFTVIFLYLQFYSKRQQTKKLTWLSSVPFIGDAVTLIKYYSEIAITIIQLFFKKSPDWFGPAVGIFVKDPGDAEIVLNSQKALGRPMELYKISVPFVGSGLFSNGDVSVWKKDRKLLSSSFSQKNSAGYYDIFHANSRQLVEDLKKEDGKGLFDVYRYISTANLQTLCETSLGININSKASEYTDELIHAVEWGMDVLTRRLSNMWYFFDLTYNLLPIKKEADKCVSFFKNLMNTIIDIGKAQHYKLQKEKSNEDISRKKSKYLLQDLLTPYHGGKRFTNQEVQDHINTVILGGFEATTATISFASVILGIYPELQEKVYQEILDVVGTDRHIEFDDLKNLKYMEQVIQETLRFFPAGPLVARKAKEEIQLSTQKVPAGSTLVIGILNIHKDPKIWPNPNKFNPDRFLPEEVSKRHPYSWMPFSAGPRNCIGIRYAWIAMKVMLATVVREYHFKSNYKNIQDIPMNKGFFLKPKEGYMVEINRRNNK